MQSYSFTLQWSHMTVMSSGIMDTSTVCSTDWSGWKQRKHQSSALLQGESIDLWISLTKVIYMSWWHGSQSFVSFDVICVLPLWSLYHITGLVVNYGISNTFSLPLNQRYATPCYNKPCYNSEWHDCIIPCTLLKIPTFYIYHAKRK